MLNKSTIIAKLFKKLPLGGLGGFILVAFLLLSCSKSTGTSDTETQNKEKTLKVATLPTLDCLPLFVAYEGHYADSQGYTIMLQTHTALNDCDTAYINGSVCATPSDYVHSQKLADNTTTIYDNPNVTLFMFLNKRARLKEAKQLTDKMVACDRKGVSGILAQHVLDSVSLKNDKTFLVNFIDLQIRSKMLDNNEMDALILPEPQATSARKAGNPQVYSASRYDGKQIGRLAVRQKSADIIRSIYNRAIDSINSRGIHAYDSILVKHLNVHPSLLQSLPKHKFQKLQ